MLEAYTAAAVRAAEKPLLDQGEGPRLMQRAARGLAGAVIRRLHLMRTQGKVYGASVCLLTGSGNNGGDALYAGQYLLSRGAQVSAILTSERCHEAALCAFQAAGGRVYRLSEDLPRAASVAGRAEVLIDGILGTGARGGLRGPVAELVAQLRGHPRVIACDLPSGLDPDTGELHDPVLPAAETVSFGELKAGLLLPPGERVSGELSCVDLGLLELGEPAVRRLTETDLARHWPVPGGKDHKYTRGVLGVIAGSPSYPGAALLCVGGALAAGTGMVRYLGPADVSAKMPPEVVPGVAEVGANRVQAWLVGPGVVADARQESRCRQAIDSSLPVVVDAGAMDLLPLPEAGERLSPAVVLTPHAGELARLLSRLGVTVQREDVERRPLEYARNAAGILGATVLLKGATTLVASGDEIYSQAEGTGWLATAGSGDTLAGILGALLAAGLKPGLAAALAASAHGRAGAVAAAVSRGSHGGPITAEGIASALPGMLARLLLR